MTSYPKSVEFHEEGPREGFQIESQSFPPAERAALIEALADSGLKQVQVGSFVSPRAVPTMADTEEVFKLIKKQPGTRYTVLWLNRKGFERALRVPEADLYPTLMSYTSDAFSKRNNNCTAVEMRDRNAEWLDLYLENNLMPESAYIMTAFGCNYQGEIPVSKVTDLVKWFKDLCADRNVPLPAICLADTVGWANPEEIRRRIDAVRAVVPDARMALHLHDTRGLGAANFYAALEMGVDLFDSSVAGLGGCPFAGHGDGKAAGNVCTEDMVFMCQELGIETGIDLDKLIDAARMAETIIGRTLAGRIMHSGGLDKYRHQQVAE
ncbi:MAG: hydroxymethylglutaryl-CoA lyase [Rhodospirillales bacterium]|nr:hydroxymethylglutaryl-CoA lyase [Rhodospirillales bacterium]